jgi:tRNA nucleotidyltransferase (CCA-adding enzyme)
MAAMQVYLVGGAVRDELLGLSALERDWVVVGATPEQLQRLGYRPVGRDFPVFLHPQTKEEYALARRERKTGPGYRGFDTDASSDVTLEQDLQRRDLTINAMARSPDGALIDPYGGRADLAARLLRHVSAAFVEDPVRILRVARFAARFAHRGFHIAPETMALMRRMVESGETDALVPERVWQEMERALGEAQPAAFFDTLSECGALRVILPELAWQESDRAALRAATTLSPEVNIRLAALLAATAPELVSACCERLRIPTDARELALLCARLAVAFARALPWQPESVLAWLESADALRRPQRFSALLLACQARSGNAAAGELLQRAREAVAGVALPAEQLASSNGPAIARALRAARLVVLAQQFPAHSA